MDIGLQIERLLKYGVKSKLIEELDVVQKRNELMELLDVDEPYMGFVNDEDIQYPCEILNEMLDYCVDNDLIESDSIAYKDIMDTKIMGILVDRESNVVKEFNRLKQESDKQATDYFYDLSINSNYIRMDRINKNIEWYSKTKIGDLRVTINLSKPERDNAEIAKMKAMPKKSYPKCFLCYDNVGYKGRLDYPARQNHRVIPMTLNKENWYFQYSPYVYYNEHCILFSEEHRPMLVDNRTFTRLLDFVDYLPHYFIGANAGLPIIGGSILSHDHYQGGNADFPIEKADYKIMFESKKYNGMKLGIVNWSMSTIRMESTSRQEIYSMCVDLLNIWKNYSDETVSIIPYSIIDGEKVQHNGITPIVRKVDGKYIVNLVFRNNRTTNEYPDGIFHPHKEFHHIKKEGIGVIEVMGQAILPGRLRKELDDIKDIITQDSSLVIGDIEDNPKHPLYKHIDWIKDIIYRYDDELESNKAEEILKKDIGLIYEKILADCGVFKADEKGTEAFIKFLTLNGELIVK